MCQHPCAALTYKGRPRTDVVEVLVSKDYEPQISCSDARLSQGSADCLRLIRKSSINQRGAVFLIYDQRWVEVVVSFLWSPWYRQDVHAVSNPHSSPLGLSF